MLCVFNNNNKYRREEDYTVEKLDNKYFKEVIKMIVTDEGQMDVMSLQVWWLLRRANQHILHVILATGATSGVIRQTHMKGRFLQSLAWILQKTGWETTPG